MAETRTRSIRVLLVDDHPMLRESIKLACIDESNIEVVGEAGDGRTALEQLAQLKPDVMVLDLVMPGIDGMDVAKQALSISPSSRIVVFSSKDDVSLFEMMRLHIAGFVNKSSDSDVIVEAIRAAGAGKDSFSTTQYESAQRELGLFIAQTREASRAGAAITQREREVLDLMREGLATKQMARRMDLSQRTIEVHISNIYRKLGVFGRVQAVNRASRLGLLRDTDEISNS